MADAQTEQTVVAEPWENEPDEHTDEHAGLAIAVKRCRNLKHLCGYVGLPEGHRYFGCSHKQIPIDVHGGLTYSEHDDDGLWWVGFDCAHAGDLVPGTCSNPLDDLIVDFATEAERDGLVGQITGPGATYRSFEWVLAETLRLAGALAEDPDTSAKEEPCV